MNINNYWGDLSDVLAATKSLLRTCCTLSELFSKLNKVFLGHLHPESVFFNKHK